jgi:hypothetical protein
MSAAYALQIALQARFSADTTIRAALGTPVRLWDGVPESPQFPYAVWTRVETTPADADDAPGEAHILTLSVWSFYDGRAEVMAALSALKASAHNASLALTGHRLILLRATFADSFRTLDGTAMVGLLRLRARTEPL